MNEEENEDSIGKALGLTPLESVSVKIENVLTEAHNDSAKKDFESARANIHTLIEEGKEAFFKLSEISASSQHPRSFEVLVKMMDSLVAANQKLLDLQSKIRELDTIDSPINEKAKTINNNLFVGSTAELQKVLQDLKKNGDA